MRTGSVHPTHAATHQRLLRAWQWVGPISVTAFILVLTLLWVSYEDVLLAWKSGLDPLPFFALLALAGCLGIPTTPFYLLAGVLFGPAVALVGSALSVLTYQSLAYGIARGPLRGWSDRISGPLERRFASYRLARPYLRVVLVRLLPGLPGALKNYLAASVGAGFGVYLLVSWPLGMAGAAALVAVGEAVATWRPWEALLVVLALLAAAWLFRRLRGRRQAAVLDSMVSPFSPPASALAGEQTTGG